MALNADEKPEWTWHPEPPPINDRPSTRPDSIRKSFHRDLHEQIESAFQEACLTGELAVAEDLLRTLEAMQDRASQPDDDRSLRYSSQIAVLRETLGQYRQFQSGPRPDRKGDVLSPSS